MGLISQVRANNPPTAQMLWEEGAVMGLAEADDLSAKSTDILAGGEMCSAAFSDSLEYLRLLLRFGVNPDACDYDRRTAAHIACAEGFLDVVQILHEYGADFAFRDRWGQTPLDEARQNGQTEILSLVEGRTAWLGKKAEKAGLAAEEGIALSRSKRQPPRKKDVVAAEYVRDLSRQIWERAKEEAEDEEREAALDEALALEAEQSGADDGGGAQARAGLPGQPSRAAPSRRRRVMMTDEGAG